LNPRLAPIVGVLRDNLLEWEDYDVAAYKLGISLGLFEADDGSYEQFREHKSIFWTSNPVGKFLHETLEALVTFGVLEDDKEAHKFRWKSGSEREVLA
jgi:hypothetical protein